MAYDRYVAICKPLHYGTIMGSRACVKMAAAAWASGFLNALLHTANTFSIPLCQGNTVDQFFCEIPQILKLSCSDSYLREVGLTMVSLSLVFGCFIFIVVSYVQIFTAVLRIPSEQGRHKAFSMCLPHLAVVSLFVSTGLFAYLKPPSISSPAVDLVVAVLYSVVPPALSPAHVLETISLTLHAGPYPKSHIQKRVHAQLEDCASNCDPREASPLLGPLQLVALQASCDPFNLNYPKSL
ncbi:olfactory receptor 14J1-like [Dromaius novaehollandiae]|uniref:olfactory receptor 14J1-like n=1 Tax=Dromaius novaehollandiae TaxID=8790 RepID=UPI00311F853A